MIADRWSRVEALYEAALALDAGGRAALLAQPAVADIGPEVASLLRYADESGAFLEEPALEQAAAELAAAAPLIGRTMGGCEVHVG